MTSGSRQRTGAASSGLPRLARRFLLVLLVAAPALATIGWYASWRERLARTRTPASVASSLFFTDMEALLLRVDRTLPRLELTPDSVRVRFAADLITALTLADHLDDIQMSVNLLRRHLSGEVSRPGSASTASSTGHTGGQRWVYDALADDAPAHRLVPEGTDGLGELRLWAEARNAARRGVPPPCSLPDGRAIPADSLLTPPLALRAALLREAGLSAGLAGDARRGLALLQMVEAPYAGQRVFEDPRGAGPDGWAYRLLWYPDLHLAGDLATTLRRAALSAADSIWLSLVPPDGSYDYAQDKANPGRPLLFEAQLRWLLACTHHRLGDTGWFRRHEAVIAAGPLYPHHWVRLLATRHTGRVFDEPVTSDVQYARERLMNTLAESEAESVLVETDRLALLQLGTPAALLKQYRDAEGSQVRDRFEPMRAEFLVEVPYSTLAYAAIGRSLCMAFPLVDFVSDRWHDPSGLEGVTEGLDPQHAWLGLLPARVQAARALGRLSALPSITEESRHVSQELGFSRPNAWHPECSRRHEPIELSHYVPGLQFVHSLVASLVHAPPDGGKVYRN